MKVYRNGGLSQVSGALAVTSFVPLCFPLAYDDGMLDPMRLFALTPIPRPDGLLSRAQSVGRKLEALARLDTDQKEKAGGCHTTGLMLLFLFVLFNPPPPTPTP